MIDGIVYGEESDVDPKGTRISHFDFYLRWSRRRWPPFGWVVVLAANDKSHEVAAAFTFGREDLFPDMFTELVTCFNHEYPGKLDAFRYYLERHMEVDEASIAAIESRIAL